MNILETHRGEMQFTAVVNEMNLDLLSDWNGSIPLQSHGQVHAVTLWRTERKWIFPTERFTTYGPEDERWCRFFGIGHEGEVRSEVHYPQAYINVSMQPSLSDTLMADVTVTPVVMPQYRRLENQT